MSQENLDRQAATPAATDRAGAMTGVTIEPVFKMRADPVEGLDAWIGRIVTVYRFGNSFASGILDRVQVVTVGVHQDTRLELAGGFEIAYDSNTDVRLNT